MTAETRVIDVPDDCPLPGGGDELALTAVERAAFDAFVHEWVTHPQAVPDMDALRLAACATRPTLTEAAARRILDDWPAGMVDEVVEAIAELCPVDPVWRAWWRLDADPLLRLEMQVCETQRVPHSFLLGTRRPRWTQQDRELALAWQMRKNATCPGCGTRRDEWDRDDLAYIGDVHTPDRGCRELQLIDDQITDEERKAGVRAILVRRAEFERREFEEAARGAAR